MIWRVDRRELFLDLRSARRGRSGPLTVSFVPASTAEPPRVAFAISHKVGGAVVRNRVRRRLRALLRDPSTTVYPGAYLVRATSAAATAPFEQLRSDLERAIQRALAPSSPGGSAP